MISILDNRCAMYQWPQEDMNMNLMYLVTNKGESEVLHMIVPHSSNQKICNENDLRDNLCFENEITTNNNDFPRNKHD